MIDKINKLTHKSGDVMMGSIIILMIVTVLHLNIGLPKLAIVIVMYGCLGVMLYSVVLLVILILALLYEGFKWTYKYIKCRGESNE